MTTEPSLPVDVAAPSGERTHDSLSVRETTKVPHVAVAFWVVKLLTTGMGEAISDWLASGNRFLAVGLGLVGLIAALAVQLRLRRYHPVAYWVSVAMVAVFGTMAADAVHVVLGIPYAITTAGYALAVIVVLMVWRRLEATVSIHSIVTWRREALYWTTVLATFALGTAAGDLTAFTLKLGYLDSIMVFAVLMMIVLVLWRVRLLGPVASFWTAYVFTRPLGASIADWLGKPNEHGGGLGWGDGPVCLGALVVFAGLVAWLAVSHHDHPRAQD